MDEKSTWQSFERSEKIGELVKALNASADKVKHAEKNAKNPHLGNKYADLSSVLDAVAEIHKHGLSLIQFPSGDASAVTVTSLLVHESDQWVSCSLTIRPEKQTAQGMGSAITYARRYTASALLGISQVDDDGNEASGRAEPTRQQPAAQAKKTSPAEGSALVALLGDAKTREDIDAVMPRLQKCKADKSFPKAEMDAIVSAYKRATERVEGEE